MSGTILKLWKVAQVHKCDAYQNKPTINRSYKCPLIYINSWLLFKNTVFRMIFSSVNSSILPLVVWGVSTVSPILSCMVLCVRCEHRNIIFHLQCQTCGPSGWRTMFTRRHEAHDNLQSSVAITAFLWRKHMCQSCRGEMCFSELLYNIS